MNDNLPPLPIPDKQGCEDDPMYGILPVDYYTAEQMQAYARAALAAAPQPQPVQPTDSMGMPECRGPLCAPNDHHQLCSHKPQPVQGVEHCLWARNGNSRCPVPQAQPQPVQEQCPECDGTGTVAGSQAHFPCPLCTSPQAKPTQPLSDEQIDAIAGPGPDYFDRNAFARAIEKAHGITKGAT